MRRYFRVYKKLMELNLATLTAYRSNFVNSVVSSIVWGLFTVFSVILLTNRVDSLFGWSRDEIILLTCVFNIILGIFHLLFSRNFEYFSRIVHLGQLDTFLLKPVDAQFLLSTRYINYTSIIRIFFGIGLTCYFLRERLFAIQLIDIVLFLLFSICGIVLLYSIWYMVTTVTIWFSRLNNIVDVLFTMSSITRYPPEMYREFSIYVFAFLFPLILIITTPTKFLLGRPDASSVFSLIILSIVFFVASRKFWRFALRSYSSASS